MGPGSEYSNGENSLAFGLVLVLDLDLTWS